METDALWHKIGAFGAVGEWHHRAGEGRRLGNLNP